MTDFKGKNRDKRSSQECKVIYGAFLNATKGFLIKRKMLNYHRILVRAIPCGCPNLEELLELGQPQGIWGNHKGLPVQENSVFGDLNFYKKTLMLH